MRVPVPVASNHPAFEGHFPGMPILPGAILLDEALRAIARIEAIDLTRWTLSSAKFLALVRPGDALGLEHERTAAGTLRFDIRNGDRRVVSGVLSPRMDGT